jgi:hypothetical protein
MSQSADRGHTASKWMREPSSGTRVVVIAAGLDSEHIDVMHHNFSCFENIALMRMEVAPVTAGLFETHLPSCDYCLVVAGELNEGFLGDLSRRRISVYPIAEDGPIERSLIEAVDHVKRLARATPSAPMVPEPDLCRRCP